MLSIGSVIWLIYAQVAVNSDAGAGLLRWFFRTHVNMILPPLRSLSFLHSVNVRNGGMLDQPSVARSLEIVSRTFCRLVIIEILLHAYFEYFLDIVVWHIRY